MSAIAATAPESTNMDKPATGWGIVAGAAMGTIFFGPSFAAYTMHAADRIAAVTNTNLSNLDMGVIGVGSAVIPTLITTAVHSRNPKLANTAIAVAATSLFVGGVSAPATQLVGRTVYQITSDQIGHKTTAEGHTLTGISSALAFGIAVTLIGRKLYKALDR